ncbi:MAG: hypothetical protein O2962_02760 [Cyanobacteria bacterium]|nr:hypothetical protein [Cyanobacteriota bacterium]
MSSIRGMFLKLEGLDRQAQAGRGKNAESIGPLSDFDSNSLRDFPAAPKGDPVSRHHIRSIAFAGQEDNGVKRHSTARDANSLAYRAALIKSMRL